MAPFAGNAGDAPGGYYTGRDGLPRLGDRQQTRRRLGGRNAGEARSDDRREVSGVSGPSGIAGHPA